MTFFFKYFDMEKTNGGFFMKRLISLLIYTICAANAGLAFADADMANYCSAPPYVTRTVPPNIMILMDNSENMTQMAYTQDYNPNSTYEGYFRSDLKYRYGTNSFIPDANGNFSGNLLNWATMSRYDLLQKILVGGMSASRQTNVNTLRSDSDSWTKVYHPTATTGCVFKVNGGNVTITDDPALGANSCPLLRTPPEWLASSQTGVKVYDSYSRLKFFVAGIINRLFDAADRVGTIVARAFDSLASSAFATKPLSIDTRSVSSANQGQPYSMSISATGGTGTSYTWSISGGALPAGLTLNSSNTSTTTITGTTTVASGNYSFTVQVANNAGETYTRSYTLTVEASSLHTSPNYSVWVCAGDYATNCNSANACQSETDTNCVIMKSGIVNDFWGKARFGLQDFTQQSSTISPTRENCIPANPLSSFLTNIENATAVGDSTHITPLVNGVYTAVDYYQNNTSNSCDPFDGAYRCTKNFILMITGGEGATTGSNTFDDPTHCSSYSSNKLAKNTCFAFNNDLRTSDGNQNVLTYVVNTMGTNADILREAATAGGGKYYSSNDGTDLRAQLLNAFTDILSKAASGTAVSVLTTSSRGTGSMVQAYFLPSKQDGTRTVNWTGYLQNIWVDSQDNIREDTTNDMALITDSAGRSDGDMVMKLYFDSAANETKAALFTTNDDGTGGTLEACGDTSASNHSPTAVKPFSNVNYIWEAGKKLADRDPSTRTLYTSKKVFYGTSTLLNDTTTNFSSFSDSTRTAALNADATYSSYSDYIRRYVRGECLETVGGGASCTDTINPLFRDRRLTMSDGSLKVWKLGDIISSTPKVFSNTPLNTYHVDYGDTSYYDYVSSNDYRLKSSIAFVGSNDGMLHAFRVGYLKNTGLLSWVKAIFKKLFSSSDDTSTSENQTLGEEVWGFIPFNAFPYLKYLADPNYCHVYYNDLSVRLVDASIGDPTDTTINQATFPTASKGGSSWRTVLIGGMRFGGAAAGSTPHDTSNTSTRLNAGFSAYYALDITDPENPIPLWEFSDPDMGYSTSFPAVIRTGGPGENGKWYVAVGSGSTQLPKASTDIARNSTGYLYILDLKTGQLVKKISLGSDNAIVGDILSIDKEKDYVSEKLYFGTAYNVSGSWKGKLMGLGISPSDSVSNLCGNSNVTETTCSALQTLFSPRTGDYFPITASPDAVKDALGNVWVYAGSGKYNSDVDESDVSQQVFFGLIDSGSTRTLDSMDNRTNAQTTGTVTKTSTVCGYDSTTNSFGPQTVVTAINAISPTPTPSTIGWYVLLSNKERVITRPMAVGGVVDFLTYTPSSDLCSYGGSSALYALGYTTGVAPSNVALRGAGATSGTSGYVTVYKRITLGPGAPPTGEGIIIPPPKAGQENLKKKIQVATGVIVEAENQPVLSVISKVVHWLKK
jgi:Tfp pilus tip-associated adhesin PilY1